MEAKLNWRRGSAALPELGLAPRFEIKLNGFAEVLLGGNQRPALGRYRQVQTTRNEPLAVTLKHCMDRSHTTTMPSPQPVGKRLFTVPPLPGQITKLSYLGDCIFRAAGQSVPL